MLRADFRRVAGDDARFGLVRFLVLCAYRPGLLAVALYRLQDLAVTRGSLRIAGLIRSLNQTITGADFVNGCKFGAGLLLPHPSGVVVGYAVMAGERCTLLQQVTLGESGANEALDSTGNPLLGDDVTVGAGAKVLGAVSLGKSSVIGANAVVLKSVPEGAVAVGVPARIVVRDVDES